MKNKIFTTNNLFITALMLIGTFSRFIPHLPNFTSIAAIALFGGALLDRKYLAFLIPIVALLISDIIIGFHSYMLAVYISFVITVLLGFAIRKNPKSYLIIGASVLSSVLFYLITNFAVWYLSPYYPQNINGLLACYIIALPFLNNGILGDLFFNSIFFGAYYLAIQKYYILKTIKN